MVFGALDLDVTVKITSIINFFIEPAGVIYEVDFL
jgi:hypothetical protein